MAINIYRPEYVRKLFNSISGSYERMNYITSFGFSIRWRRQCLQHMEPSAAPVEIMDLLTGMGETWHAIKQKFPNGHISALDFSPDMLKKAARKNTRYFNNEITLWQQDLLQNGLPDNHFDLVVCAYGLKTFDRNQLEIVAKETARILKPGGRFAFVEVSRPEPKILQLLYRFYLAKVIPLLGRLFLGDPTPTGCYGNIPSCFKMRNKRKRYSDRPVCTPHRPLIFTDALPASAVVNKDAAC